jgi:hypothetical protein
MRQLNTAAPRELERYRFLVHLLEHLNAGSRVFVVAFRSYCSSLYPQGVKVSSNLLLKSLSQVSLPLTTSCFDCKLFSFLLKPALCSHFQT